MAVATSGIAGRAFMSLDRYFFRASTYLDVADWKVAGTVEVRDLASKPDQAMTASLSNRIGR